MKVSITFLLDVAALWEWWTELRPSPWIRLQRQRYLICHFVTNYRLLSDWIGLRGGRWVVSFLLGMLILSRLAQSVFSTNNQQDVSASNTHCVKSKL